MANSESKWRSAVHGHRFFMLAIAALALAGSGCSAQPPAGSGASPGQASTTPSSSAPASVQPSGASPSSAQPSDGTAGADCDARQIAASDAQNTLVLSWETIDYQVKTDKDWKEQIDAGYLDVAKYRAAAELVKDLPDAVKPNHPKDLWSKNSGPALKLASLLEQAAASGTPFADGIGKQIVALANDLRGSGMWAIYDAVDSMCYDPADEVAAGGVDELIAILAPPNAKETDRLTSPTFSTFEYTSSDSIDALTSHFEAAIPKTGWKIFFTDSLGGDGKYWDITGPGSPGRGTITLRPATSGPGIKVVISFTG